MKIKILHKTPKGFLIGRGKNVKINSPVYFKKKKIGVIVDIFGPVSNPYIKIKPIKKDINVDFVFTNKN
ncbi:H/ACA RNA-protein complex component Gar1 [Methanocaldococcus villosus KIN24-T80]|uniref:H/ACA RNA-protein complex component Gar1 n=1 Tax=Methanocaldococcus villosus KIN24-T80 TaxID=1069083 RepID=N6VRC8_9EURY|nr:Gar1/Naf1 family protein [Methanocaldococcus villosus]ENN95711.1 H/ACA RNA-protein complex component Gar1 [Methanocaldococcus villosus KIN24-T80]